MNTALGVLHKMCSTVLPVFPTRPRYSYEDGGTDGARDRGYRRTVFPGLPICLESHLVLFPDDMGLFPRKPVGNKLGPILIPEMN